MTVCSLEVLSNVEVEWEVLPEWTEDISTMTKFEDLPINCQKYLLRVQQLVGMPIRWIGVGPNRLDIIDCGEGWELSSSSKD
jgi:adenylosuccinate synthase